MSGGIHGNLAVGEATGVKELKDFRVDLLGLGVEGGEVVAEVLGDEGPGDFVGGDFALAEAADGGCAVAVAEVGGGAFDAEAHAQEAEREQEAAQDEGCRTVHCHSGLCVSLKVSYGMNFS